jgi:hypothetical protein
MEFYQKQHVCFLHAVSSVAEALIGVSSLSVSESNRNWDPNE